MNTQSNAMSGSPLESSIATSPFISPSQRMYWSVRRELWEYRSIYIAPLSVAALILVGFLIGMIHMAGNLRITVDIEQQHRIIEQPYNFAAFLIMLTTFIVSVFYCLTALHSDRRDRSILFWKSLPVSDLTTVLSKASVPLVILPLITFAITATTQCMMLLLGSAILLGRGQSAAMLWGHATLLQMWLMLLYHLVAIHALWYAPIYGWLLLVSGWVRRAAVLWAALPLLAISIVEKIAFNTSYFATMLQNRLSGGHEGAAFAAGSMSMDPLTQLNPGQFLISPGLWIGLGITAIFLAAAVRLRRYRGPI